MKVEILAMGSGDAKTQLPCRTCPAVPLALLLLNSVLAALLPLAGFLSWTAALPWALIFTVILVLFFRINLWKSAFFVIIGFGLAVTGWHLPFHTYQRDLPRIPASAHVRGTVIEPCYGGDNISWLQAKRRYKLKVREIKPLGAREWRRRNGIVLLVTDGAQSLSYGQTITARIAVTQPDSGQVDGAFDYALYLRGQRILHTFQTVEAVRIEHAPRGWRRVPAFLYHCRDRLVENLVENVPSEINARMLAALVFGYREALPGTLRRSFLTGGAVHLFAVSGLHIGIVATLFLLLLRLARVPYRVRYWWLPVILVFYVFITGGSPPAVRAWLMITVWSVSQARLRAGSPINAVAIAAIILLAWNPMQALMPGFQFSFLIVSFLLIGWRMAEMVRIAMCEKTYWQPYSRQACKFWEPEAWAPPVVSLCSVVLLAWIGSAGLVAAKNAMIIPAGILVNLLLSLMAWCALFVAMIKTVISFLPVQSFDIVIGWVLEQIMTAIRGGVTAADWFGGALYIARPPAAMVLLYYSALAVGLLPGLRLKLRYVGWGTAAFCLMLIVLHKNADAGGVFAFLGDGTNQPVIAMIEDRGKNPALINTGNYNRARNVKAWLRQHGYDGIRLVVLHDQGWEAASGLASLLEEYPVETLVVYPTRRPQLPDRLSKRARDNVGRIRYAEPVESSQPGNQYEIKLGDTVIIFDRGGEVNGTRLISRQARGRELAVYTTRNGTGKIQYIENAAALPVTRKFWTSMAPRFQRW